MTDDTRSADPAALFAADQEEMFEMMWPEILSQTVIEMLAEFGSISRADLIAELERRRDAEHATRLDKAKLRGTLRALRG